MAKTNTFLITNLITALKGAVQVENLLIGINCNGYLTYEKKEINSAQSCEILNTQRSARADYSLLHKQAKPEAVRGRQKLNQL